MALLLKTARLQLRHFELSDTDFVIHLLNQPSFIKNIADRGVRNSEQAALYLQNGPMKSYAQNGFGLYAVELSGHPIGMCGLIRREGLKDVDIGFAFLPEYFGQGYALESSMSVLQYARDVLEIKRVVAITNTNNTGSMRVLEKLGMKFVSVISLPHTSEPLNLFAIDF